MLVRLLAVTVAVCVALPPAPADACENFVRYNIDESVRMMVRAEKQFEAGQYARAMRTLRSVHIPMTVLAPEPDSKESRLELRKGTLERLVKLRSHAAEADYEGIVTYFKERTEDKETAKDVRYRAWLAEAYVAAGKPDEARAILVDLHTHDLMPDGYGYRVLAGLSTGTERYDYYKACRTRAANKSLCELPAAKKPNVNARR